MRSRYFDDDDTPRGQREPAVTARAARPGPVAMPNDSWDAAHDRWDAAHDRWDAAHDHDTVHYRGRRRANPPPPPRWRLVGVTVMLMGLIGTLALAKAPPAHNDAATPNATIPIAWPQAESTSSIPAEPSSSSPASPQKTSRSHATSRSRAVQSQSPHVPSQSRAIPPAAQSDATLPTTPPSFPSVTLEAEAGSPTVTLSGSAQVQQYPSASGGQIVTDLGNMGTGEAPGALLINGLDIPAGGTYQLAVYFIHPAAGGTGSAVISVSGVQPVSITLAAGDSCCGVTYLEIAIEAGTHTIAISNPAQVAPSIDKIVISRP